MVSLGDREHLLMGLRENILLERVSDLPLRPLVFMQVDETVRSVLHRMSEGGLGAAITVDADGKPVGMFNEKLLIRLLHENPAAMDQPVGQVMTRNVICVQQGDSIATLIATMQQRKLRWVCVVDETGKATALTGLRGAMEYIVDHFPRRVYVQSTKSKLAVDQREGA